MSTQAITQHRRRTIRLPAYDYSSPGAYFVTIRVQGGECLLGDVIGETMNLSIFGQIAWRAWKRLPSHFPNLVLDAWTVMPNHMHGLLLITARCDPAASGHLEVASPGAGLNAASRPPRAPAPGSLGVIVGNLKSVSARRINQLRKTPGQAVWQRNYWEHIVRDDESLRRIREYIQTNPARWAEDRLNPNR